MIPPKTGGDVALICLVVLPLALVAFGTLTSLWFMWIAGYSF